MTFAKPSEAPATEGWKFEDEENIGSLFVFEPKEEKEVETKQFGDKPVVVADITEIDLENPSESETHKDVYVFAGWVRGSIRHAISTEEMVLGRLQQDADKGQGKNVAWVIEDPDEEDIEAATAWLNARGRSKLGVDKESSKKKSSKKK